MTNEVADVVNTFRIIAELPADSMGAYVISMARSASDVLAVTLLQRECGVTVGMLQRSDMSQHAAKCFCTQLQHTGVHHSAPAAL
jgi:phosphoenolpyruvate carboxylase